MIQNKIFTFQLKNDEKTDLNRFVSTVDIMRF